MRISIDELMAAFRILPRIAGLSIAIAVTAASQGQTIWHVDDDALAPGDGFEWATAFRDLQLALAAASEFDVIRVAQGTYKPAPNLDPTLSFVLINGVTIEGGYRGPFDGTGMPPDDRDIAVFETILSGLLNPFGSERSYHVVVAPTLTDNTAVLDGFTVREGDAAGTATAQRSGGGIRCENAAIEPCISNARIIANESAEVFQRRNLGAEWGVRQWLLPPPRRDRAAPSDRGSRGSPGGGT